MPEPANFNAPSADAPNRAGGRWTYTVARMVAGAALVFVFGSWLQEPDVPSSTAIPVQDRWQAAIAGRSPAGEVVVSGRAEALPGAEPLVPPVSRKPALAYSVVVEHVRMRRVTRGKTHHMEKTVLATNLKASRQTPFTVETSDGPVVVKAEVGDWLLPAARAVHHDRGTTLPAWTRGMPGVVHDVPWYVQDETLYDSEEIALRAGDAVSFIGVVREAGARRELVPRPGDKTLVAYLRGREAIETRIRLAGEDQRNKRRLNEFGLAAGLVLLFPWELLVRLRRRKAAQAREAVASVDVNEA